MKKKYCCAVSTLTEASQDLNARPSEEGSEERSFDPHLSLLFLFWVIADGRGRREKRGGGVGDV